MDFDFQGLALALAAVSLGGIGVILAGAFMFPQWSQRAMKEQLPFVIIGVVLVGVSGLILSSLGGGNAQVAGPLLNWSVPLVVPHALPSPLPLLGLAA